MAAALFPGPTSPGVMYSDYFKPAVPLPAIAFILANVSIGAS